MMFCPRWQKISKEFCIRLLSPFGLPFVQRDTLRGSERGGEPTALSPCSLHCSLAFFEGTSAQIVDVKSRNNATRNLLDQLWPHHGLVGFSRHPTQPNPMTIWRLLSIPSIDVDRTKN